eukprot:1902313-Prymnesium_polylepis.1
MGHIQQCRSGARPPPAVQIHMRPVPRRARHAAALVGYSARFWRCDRTGKERRAEHGDCDGARAVPGLPAGPLPLAQSCLLYTSDAADDM